MFQHQKQRLFSNHQTWQQSIQAGLIEKEINQRNLNPSTSPISRKLAVKGPITDINSP